jgi:hypothetical protein
MDRQHYDRMEVAQEKAEASGCVIDLATPHLLQLDLDSEAAYKLFLEQVRLLHDHEIIPTDTQVVARPSKSGNLHVTLILPKYTDWPTTKRIMVQALLGSDLKREALNLSRFQHSAPEAILLFRPKDETIPMPAYFNAKDIDTLNVLLTGVSYI